MRIRMLRDLEIAFDGRTVRELKRGESYDVPEAFVPNLLRKGYAEEDKAIDKAPETKTVRTTKKPARRRAKKLEA